MRKTIFDKSENLKERINYYINNKFFHNWNFKTEQDLNKYIDITQIEKNLICMSVNEDTLKEKIEISFLLQNGIDWVVLWLERKVK